MIWNSIDYSIRVTLFIAKDNPLPQNYEPEDLWQPIWSKGEVEAFAERLNAKWRQVRVAESFDEIFEFFDMDIKGYIVAMTLKYDNSNLEKTICHRYYVDPKEKCRAVRIRVEMLPVPKI